MKTVIINYLFTNILIASQHLISRPEDKRSIGDTRLHTRCGKNKHIPVLCTPPICHTSAFLLLLKR